VGFTGIDADQTYQMRGRLAEKDIHLTVVKNSLARQAFKEVGLDSAVGLLDGPCAIVYGGDSVVTIVRELLDIRKIAPTLEVKGAVLDGDIFSGADEVKQLSNFPTREEAIGQVVQCALSAGANLAGCLLGPAGQIAGILKTIEEKDEAA
jgi:large subunit ribosomal protein L10